MHRNKNNIRHRYAYCSVLSSIAGILGFVNPLLSSVLVAKLMHRFDLIEILPYVFAMAAVKGTRIYLRFTISVILEGNQRAPLIWLQHRIGRWLWWVEPLVHNWGAVGMMITRLSGNNGLSGQIASFITYFITDTAITVSSGIVYYYTQSYVLSLLSVPLLPMLIILPWATEKSLRINNVRHNTAVHAHKRP